MAVAKICIQQKLFGPDFAEFQFAMRPTTGSKQTHLSCFLPIHVFVDLFVVASSNVTRKPTMFVFKLMKKELTDSLMDQGRNIKVSIGVDHIKCTADSTSLVFRYHIGRSILYTTLCTIEKGKLVVINGRLWIILSLKLL